MKNICFGIALVVCFFSFAASAQQLTIAPGVTVTVPSGWRAIRDTSTSFLVEHGPSGKPADASTSIQVETRRNHAEAVQRLAEIETEHPGDIKYSLIAGWPALERKATVAFQYPGELPQQQSTEEAQGTDEQRLPHGRGDETSIRVTTAIAVAEMVVRLQTLLQPDADPTLADQALAIARTLTAPPANKQQSADDLRQLQSGTLQPKTRPVQPHAPSTMVSPEPQRERHGVPGGGGGGSVAVNGGGEIEAAASGDGQKFVIDAGCQISYSTNGGANFKASNINYTGAPALDGDCVLTWGQSGHFYLGVLGSGKGHSPEWVALFKSSDQGANFSYVTNAVDRSSPPVINVDQPHIAADRWNASSSNQDQVYVVWHETGSFQARVSCSSKGGASGSWSAPKVAGTGNFSFPKVAVGKDGMVYVVSRSGSHVVVEKFSSCDDGLKEQSGFPRSIKIDDVDCPVPGLDRCNNGNTLASPTIAVDDTYPKHVYIAWAQSTGSGDEIAVTDSWDGGEHFPNPVAAANSGPKGVRFLPWLGAWGGTAYLGWYDRRTATASAPARTRYYRGSVSASNGKLTAGDDADLMGVDDPQCLSPFNCGVRSPGDCDKCSPPRPGGFCRHTPNNSSDSKTPCDFVTTVCPSGESCQTGNGCPKYGDYNGLAVGGGRMLNIWASGAAPSDLPKASSNAIRAYTVVTDLPSDFFVRDWTKNAHDHDTGVEPSTNAVFYETSDVWNQGSGTAYGGVDDWVEGDAPVRSGANFAFARVSRRAPAASTVAPVSVKVEFLAADFGLGSPFTVLGSETVTMDATNDTKVSPGLSWNVAPTASTHLCLAVQISAPGDPYKSPTLAGGAPAPSEPHILTDNNKAQRNLRTTVGSGHEGGVGIGIVHNIVKDKRDMVLDYSVDPDSQKFMEGGSIKIIGAQTQNVGLQNSGRIVLQGMQPGEDRFVELDFGKVTSDLGKLVKVRFTEMEQDKAINGFTIAYKRATNAVVARDLLSEEADLLSRIAAITGAPNAKAKADESTQLLVQAPTEVEVPRYRTIARQHLQVLRHVVQNRLSLPATNDPFGVNAALDNLDRALATAGNDESVLTAHQALIQRLDAHLTWMQKQGK